MSKKRYPKAGDRVGCVCGPSELPTDDQGIVIAVYDDAWYSDQAVILMDSGRIMYAVGAYTKAGIGWYLLKEGVAA